jgi:WD40 repeat protein
MVSKDKSQQRDIEDNENIADVITRRTRKRQLLNGSAVTEAPVSIFHIKLRPEEFRRGTRCKHIDSISINKRGFLAAGTNTGDLYLWRMNFGSIRKRRPEGVFSWFNSFKLHKKSIYSMKFSPTGDFLMTASSDGSVSLWNTSFSQAKTENPLKNIIQHDHQVTDTEEPHVDLREIDFTDSLLEHKFQEQVEKETEGQKKET